MILLPNGGYFLLPLTLATMGWIASLLPDGCDYVRLTGPSVEVVTKSDVLPYIEAGMNSYRIPTFFPDRSEWRTIYTDECLDYGAPLNPKGDNEWDFGMAWRFGKTCSFLGTVFGGGGALFLWFGAICMTFTKKTWTWAGVELVVAFLFQVFSFIWLATNICQRGNSYPGAGCHLFFGSNMSIFSCVAYAAAALSIFVKYPEPKLIRMVEKGRRNKSRDELTPFHSSTYSGGRDDFERSTRSLSLYSQNSTLYTSTS